MAKTAIITGATSGIGKSLSFELAGRGYALGLTGRRGEVLEEIAAALRAKDGATARAPAASNGAPCRVETRVLDVRDSAAVHAAIPDLATRLGGIELVVANAGIGGERQVGTGGFESDEDVIRTNVIGAMATVDAAVELFRAAGAGQVVGITSVAGFRGLPGNAAYSASKAALSVYLEGVRAEVEGLGIAVTTIAPGFIDTPINERLASRPFLVSAAEGARQIADLIERRVRHSTVPVLPWGAVGTLMRTLPDAIWYRAVRLGAPKNR
jgi:short-subunit dehydrogenase